jgi:hypothetical protein
MSDYTEPLALALIFIGSGLAAKFLSRRDNDPAPKVNEWALSTTICLMTLGKIASDYFVPNAGAASSDAAAGTASSTASHNPNLGWAIGLAALLWSIFWDRYASWIAGSNPGKKKLWIGVIIPDIVAVGALFLYFVYRSYLIH